MKRVRISPEQRRIMEYLYRKHAENREVIPAHWLLIDLYGVDGRKYNYSGGHHMYEPAGDYAVKKASMYRSLRRLRDRGLVVGKRGIIDDTWWPGHITEGYYPNSFGYAMHDAPAFRENRP